ncbi:MAG: TrkA family potassium uptake protein [Anaerolineae bacterium]|nr:TrkA family potassium uptake protein [Thermoflexales bacterium]MDW8407570.1 TrkA family potassium uptake protein [Anaerolineae bacterium]
MFVVIVGGGRTGSHLARMLHGQGHEVRVVDDRPEVVAKLRRELSDEIAVLGDVSSPTVLEAAGIHRAQVLAAVTADDEANLVVTTLGRFEFRVPRTIARVNNPENAWMFTADMGVDVALNQADIMGRLIAEEMSLGDMMTLLKLRKGQFSVVEEKVHPLAPACGKAISELALPPECVLIAIIRKGDLILPRGDVVLQQADEILAVVHSSQVIELASLLGPARP